MPWLSNAQTYTTVKTASDALKKQYLEGLQFNKKGEYERSVKVFSKVIKQEPRFIDARIQFAAALEEMKSIETAIDEYKSVLKIDTLYEPRVLKALGRLLKSQNRYQEAAYFYQRFYVLSKGPEESRESARMEAESCLLMDKAIKSPWDVNPENLGPSINTATHEYLPCISVDGQELIFTRIVNGNEDFYQSKLGKENKWLPSTPISELNTRENEGAQTVSADGKTLVFVACDYPDTYGSCDLYISYNAKGIWSKPRNMGQNVNSTAWDTQPSLSANGNQLFFTSNRTGGMGDSDIWVSEKSSSGKWEKPRPLPAPVNDENKSESPFIHPDGRTLYYRSNRKPGFGGFDLFMSRLSDDGVWSAPLNLGYPINTPKDEGALVVSLDGEYGYYASDAEAKSGEKSNYGKNDIYRFRMPEPLRPSMVTYVRATVVEQSTNKPLQARVELKSLGENTSPLEMDTDESGSFLVCIPSGKSYALNVSKEGYTFYSDNFTLDTIRRADPFLIEVHLQKLQPSVRNAQKPIILNNIFFDTGSSVLKDDSHYELNKLYELLKTNPDLKIQINGHTDDIGEVAVNQKLSEDRAKAVYDYLASKGIDSKRLSYKGFGESKPIVENKDSHSRQTNRRTEFEIK